MANPSIQSVPTALILSVIDTESNGDVNAYNPEINRAGWLLGERLDRDRDPYYMMNQFGAAGRSRGTEDPWAWGAWGLMQVTYATALDVGLSDSRHPRTALLDRRQNVLIGTSYLKRLHDRFGDWNDAICAYNSGRACAQAPASTTGSYLPAVAGRYREYAASGAA